MLLGGVALTVALFPTAGAEGLPVSMDADGAAPPVAVALADSDANGPTSAGAASREEHPLASASSSTAPKAADLTAGT